MQSMYQKYQEMGANGNVVQQQIKVWYGHSYFFDGSWENIGGVKRESDRHRLINATIFKGGSSYSALICIYENWNLYYNLFSICYKYIMHFIQKKLSA